MPSIIANITIATPNTKYKSNHNEPNSATKLHANLKENMNAITKPDLTLLIKIQIDKKSIKPTISRTGNSTEDVFI